MAIIVVCDVADPDLLRPLTLDLEAHVDVGAKLVAQLERHIHLFVQRRVRYGLGAGRLGLVPQRPLLAVGREQEGPDGLLLLVAVDLAAEADVLVLVYVVLLRARRLASRRRRSRATCTSTSTS